MPNCELNAVLQVPYATKRKDSRYKYKPERGCRAWPYEVLLRDASDECKVDYRVKAPNILLAAVLTAHTRNLYAHTARKPREYGNMMPFAVPLASCLVARGMQRKESDFEGEKLRTVAVAESLVGDLHAERLLLETLPPRPMT